MNKSLTIAAIVGGVAIIGVLFLVFFLNSDGGSPDSSNSSQKAASEQQVKKIEGYSGDVLAGEVTPYIVFNKEDYDKALAGGKIIFIDFYANWCPICRAEAPELYAGFEELSNENIVGFRVNYNDSDTDDLEKQLASDFGITYQHTKVIIKDGEEILKDLTTWDRERLIKELSNL